MWSCQMPLYGTAGLGWQGEAGAGLEAGSPMLGYNHEEIIAKGHGQNPGWAAQRPPPWTTAQPQHKAPPRAGS